MHSILQFLFRSSFFSYILLLITQLDLKSIERVQTELLIDVFAPRVWFGLGINLILKTKKKKKNQSRTENEWEIKPNQTIISVWSNSSIYPHENENQIEQELCLIIQIPPHPYKFLAQLGFHCDQHDGKADNMLTTPHFLYGKCILEATKGRKQCSWVSGKTVGLGKLPT